ncbi:MAG: PAS domain S-box protein [Nitrosomonadales bacterium]
MLTAVVLVIFLRRLTNAHELLCKSEERYHSLFDNMMDGFAYCKVLFDGDTACDLIYLSVNASFYKQTGLQDVVGKRLSEVIPGRLESNPDLLKTYGRISMSGGTERFESYVEELKTWFLISVYSPEKEYFVSVFENITERKLSEETMRQSEYRFRFMLENSPIAVRIASKKTGQVVFANRNYSELIGYSLDEAFGVDPREFYSNPQDFDDIVDRLGKGEAIINKLVKLDSRKGQSGCWRPSWLRNLTGSLSTWVGYLIYQRSSKLRLNCEYQQRLLRRMMES